MGIVLYILVLVLTPIGNLIGMFYALFKFRSYKEINTYFKRLAVSRDQYLNVTMRYFFNDTMIKDTKTKRAYHFGNEDETISSALGKNLRRGTLTKFGYFWDRVLNKLEKDHTLLAIEEDEIKPT